MSPVRKVVPKGVTSSDRQLWAMMAETEVWGLTLDLYQKMVTSMSPAAVVVLTAAPERQALKDLAAQASAPMLQPPIA